MRVNIFSVFLLVFFILPLSAFAQTNTDTPMTIDGVEYVREVKNNSVQVQTDRPMILPGSAWFVLGNLSPFEHDNCIVSGYLEQGVTLFRSEHYSLVPYVSLGIGVDSQHYDWNNRQTVQVGIKLVRNFSHGIVSVGGAYAYEHRSKSGDSAHAPVGYANYWFGWHAPTANRSSRHIRFPGSSWGVIGNVSPVEKCNLIVSDHIEQGVSVAKIGRVSLVPFAEATISGDTNGYDWNNRILYGGGVKIVIPGKSKVAELGASYLKERRFHSGIQKGGYTLFLKVWLGWSPVIPN
jgi:hypothetical protein